MTRVEVVRLLRDEFCKPQAGSVLSMMGTQKEQKSTGKNLLQKESLMIGVTSSLQTTVKSRINLY
jgi:hypothetical protein